MAGSREPDDALGETAAVAGSPSEELAATAAATADPIASREAPIVRAGGAAAMLAKGARIGRYTVVGHLAHLG